MLAQTRMNSEYLKDRYDYWMRGKQEKDSNLYNENTFYSYFIKDLLNAKAEVIIYSPFVSKYRTDYFKQTIEKLRKRNVEVFIFTRPVETYDLILQDQIRVALERYEELGVCVFYMPGFIHEKAAIIDREILWDGSLNILSQRASREMMRRTESEDSAMEVIKYLGINKKLAEVYKLKYEKLCRNLITNYEQNRRQKIHLFLLGLLIPVIIWWMLTYFSGIISVFIPEFLVKLFNMIIHG